MADSPPGPPPPAHVYDPDACHCLCDGLVGRGIERVGAGAGTHHELHVQHAGGARGGGERRGVKGTVLVGAGAGTHDGQAGRGGLRGIPHKLFSMLRGSGVKGSARGGACGWTEWQGMQHGPTMMA